MVWALNYVGQDPHAYTDACAAPLLHDSTPVQQGLSTL